jgi:hypothetical protein
MYVTVNCLASAVHVIDEVIGTSRNLKKNGSVGTHNRKLKGRAFLFLSSSSSGHNAHGNLS